MPSGSEQHAPEAPSRSAEEIAAGSRSGRLGWERDGGSGSGAHLVPWPSALRRFLHGTTHLQLVPT